MCIGCPDFIDQCGEDDCYHSNGGSHDSYRLFYADDKYCIHLQKKYGKSIAKMEDRYGNQ